jgi:SSS family solute:Na+ symporter
LAISWLDFFVLISYLAGITLFGAHFRKGQHSLRDYFLGGRRLPWWAISLSVVSAETSILTIISTPGIAYRTNLNFLQLVLGYLVGRVVVSFLLIPRYFAGELYTAYQLIEIRFGKMLKVFTAALFLATRALAEGVRVFAVAIVFQVVFRQGTLASLLIVTALTLLYTFEGGLTAVIWTDVIQLTIYLSGTVLTLGLALHQVPGGWAAIHHLAGISGHKFAIFDFNFNWRDPYSFWAGLVGGAFLTSASHGTDQLIVQRLLAAHNMRQSQAALLASGIVILFQFSLFLIVGVALFAFYHFHPLASAPARADMIFPYFVVHTVPLGAAGLLTAAIVAAGMANLSAALNSLASSSVVDFYKPFFKKQSSEHHYLRVSRFLTVAWGGVLVAVALGMAALRQSVLELSLTIASVPYGSMLGIFLLGTLTHDTPSTSALVGALCGLAGLLVVIKLTGVAWTWYVAIGAIITFAVGWLAGRVQLAIQHGGTNG